MLNKITFIGAGSMAEAIIAGIVNKQFLKGEQVFVTNKENEERLESLRQKYQIVGEVNKEKVIKDADVIIFSTKPHDMKEAILSVKEFIQPGQLILSVVAGVSTAFISSLIDQDVPVIRAMPNTSATIGFSATAIARGDHATNDHIAQAKQLFSAIGTVSVVEEEKMHIVTGISGSGPAYIYYLVEAMQKVAEEEGLDEETAKQLIIQTVIGAGEMLKNTTDPVTTLRENVTSPNGTTAAGIKTLSEYDFQDAVMKCVRSAKNRSAELGKNM